MRFNMILHKTCIVDAEIGMVKNEGECADRTNLFIDFESFGVVLSLSSLVRKLLLNLPDPTIFLIILILSLLYFLTP